MNQPLALLVKWRQAVMIRRYQRFMADVRLADGAVLTVHCPNTGSMKNCVLPETPCWYSTSDNPKRKYPHTLEVVTTPGGHLAGVNTGRANVLVETAIANSVISELRGYANLRREVVYGAEKSRIDFLLSGSVDDPRPCYVEVKSVTLMEDEGQGLFPDAVSTRGSKHLRELMAMVQQGYRAVLLFCVQHTGIEWVEPADHIDPTYGRHLREAIAVGVEVLAYQARIDPAIAEVALYRLLPIKIQDDF
jgi:sugar fermentation stimulation protein A